MKILLFVSIFLLFGCSQQGQQGQPNQDDNFSDQNTTGLVSDTGIQKGVTVTPKSFQASDFNDFFDKANEAGQLVAWAGDWNELGGENGGPEVVTELSSTYDYTPVIEAQFFTQSTGQLLMSFDEATKSEYKSKAVEFAEKYQPEYLGLGIEVNVLYEKSQEDFDEFVQFYSEVYDAIRVVSPNTKIFTVFQLEKMKGLGYFGTSNGEEQWFLLDEFPKSDIIAFTTYPSLVYGSPSEMPSDYYSELKTHTSKPIAFTEIGWHSAAEPVGWESSENEQVEFVSKFFELTGGMDNEFVIWSFLYDQDTTQPFDSMGLITAEGDEKLAWEIWVQED